jgi:hypothetical protein
MIRRIISLLLIPALLANQAVMCCAHTHHTGESGQHTTRTHLHLFGGGHGSHSDDHHHGPNGEHRHSDELPLEGSESTLGFGSELPVDHDNDAVFIGKNSNLCAPSNRIILEGPDFVSVFLDRKIHRPADSEHQSQISRAGPFACHCTIFLQTRRLLL